MIKTHFFVEQNHKNIFFVEQQQKNAKKAFYSELAPLTRDVACSELKR